MAAKMQFFSWSETKCTNKLIYLHGILAFSVSGETTLLVEFATSEPLVDRWIEALISPNKSASRFSNVKLSLANVDIESVDL